MVFVPEGVGFARAKHPPRTSPSVLPDGHRLIQANDPRHKEDLCHVLVSGGDPIPNLPKLIPKRRRVGQREPQCQHVHEEPPPRHVAVESNQWGFILVVLIIVVRCRCRSWCRSPKVIGQLHVTQHEKPHPNVSKHLTDCCPCTIHPDEHITHSLDNHIREEFEV